MLLFQSLLLLLAGCGKSAPDTGGAPPEDTAGAGATGPVDLDGDGYSEEDGDCDDDPVTGPGVHPGAGETADEVDQDCDDLVDEETDVYDDDGDSYSEVDGDCDDAAPEVYPGAGETADEVDQDCDDLVDEGTENYDDDGDSYSEVDGDCQDADPGINPGAEEIADEVDQDCDDLVDEGTEVYDDDGDGWSEVDGDCDDDPLTGADTQPGAPELEDGADNDCDGLTDEPMSGELDKEHLLAMPDEDGVQLLSADLSLWASYPWVDLVPDCDGSCFGEGSSTDGDTVLATYVEDTRRFVGGVVQIDVDGEVLLHIDGLDFPHDAVRDPTDGSLIVAEGFGFVGWFPGDGSSDRPLYQIDNGTTGWIRGAIPNGLDLIQYGGVTYLLICERSGVLTMWDISTPYDPTFLWRYPATGELDTPHGAVLREYGGTFYLVYAHTFGGRGRWDGAVGIAATADPGAAPDYLTDLVSPSGSPEFDFLRGVELTTGGQLLITDAGAEFADTGPDDGRLWSAALPAELAPTGATGEADRGQVYTDFTDLTELHSGIPTPFEGRLMPHP